MTGTVGGASTVPLAPLPGKPLYTRAVAAHRRSTAREIDDP